MPRDPVKRKFYGQKACAKARGISFELSFAQWLSIWTESGHFHERGTLKDQYVMARFRDRGPYAVGNVRIITGAQNRAEQVGIVTPEHAAKISAALKGKPKPKSPGQLAAIQHALAGNQFWKLRRDRC